MVFSAMSRDQPEEQSVIPRCLLRGEILSACPSALGLLDSPGSGTLPVMTITARVRDGRLVVDEPTDLPDGTEVQLLLLDPGDWLDERNRAALHEALRESGLDSTSRQVASWTLRRS